MEESTDTAQKSPVLEGMQLHQGQKWNYSCKNHGLYHSRDCFIVGTLAVIETTLGRSSEDFQWNKE